MGPSSSGNVGVRGPSSIMFRSAPRSSLSLVTLAVTLVACRPATTSGPAGSTGGSGGSGSGGEGGAPGTGGKMVTMEKDAAPVVTPPPPDGRAQDPDVASPARPEVGTDALPPLNAPVLIAAAG